MRVAIKKRVLPGMVSAAGMPNYMSYFKGVLSELGSPLRDQVSIKRTDYLNDCRF